MHYRLKHPIETPCPACGVLDVPYVAPGKAFHLAALRCRHCQHFLKWAGKRDLLPLQPPRQTPQPQPVPSDQERRRYWKQQGELRQRLDTLLEEG